MLSMQITTLPPQPCHVHCVCVGVDRLYPSDLTCPQEFDDEKLESLKELKLMVAPWLLGDFQSPLSEEDENVAAFGSTLRGAGSGGVWSSFVPVTLMPRSSVDRDIKCRDRRFNLSSLHLLMAGENAALSGCLHNLAVPDGVYETSNDFPIALKLTLFSATLVHVHQQSQLEFDADAFMFKFKIIMQLIQTISLLSPATYASPFAYLQPQLDPQQPLKDKREFWLVLGLKSVTYDSLYSLSQQFITNLPVIGDIFASGMNGGGGDGGDGMDSLTLRIGMAASAYFLSQTDSDTIVKLYGGKWSFLT